MTALPGPPARSGPGLLAALLALPLLLLAATLPTGPPPDALGRRAWDGLGPHLSARLPEGGWVIHARRVRVDGQERLIEHRSRLGDELAVSALYAVWIPLALAALRRRGGVPPLLPRPADLRLLLDALAILVPVWVLVGLVACLAARALDPQLARAAVYGWCLPALGQPDTAVWPLLRLVVLAPLAEELCWRGVVFRGLRARLPLAPAAVATALGFGLWHWLSGWQAPAALAAQYVFGLVACILVERSGGLAAPILLHALGNAVVAGLYVVCMRWPEHLLGALGL